MTASKRESPPLPARVAVRCEGCGATRTTLVLHDNALQRAQRCEACGAAATIVTATHVAGCSCCG